MKKETSVTIKDESRKENSGSLVSIFMKVISDDPTVEGEKVDGEGDGYQFTFETRKKAKAVFKEVAKKLKNSKGWDSTKDEIETRRKIIGWYIRYDNIEAEMYLGNDDGTLGEFL